MGQATGRMTDPSEGMTAARKGGSEIARASGVGAPGTVPFWQRKTLAEMTVPEWEALCDGCGKCCLNKLEDEDTGVIVATRVACRLLDDATCRCSDYADRHATVPECISLTPAKVETLRWLPATCAYRLIDEGRDLHWWHRLVSGDPDTVHEAGVSVQGATISESLVPVEEWESFVVDLDALDPDAGLNETS